MSTIAPRINYAKDAGFDSLPAAIIFAILYAPLYLLFAKKSFSRPTYVHYVMSFFCIVRFTAFIIRAVLAGSDTAGKHLGVLIADEILFDVGYAGLLYSSYTLILNLEDILKKTFSSDGIENPLIGLTRNRRLFRLVMGAAVTLGIVASSSVNDDGTSGSTSNALREASTIIFLVLTLLLVFQTIYLSRFRLRELRLAYNEHDTFGTKHGDFILMAVSLLLLVRGAFITATMTSSTRSKQSNEHFWYPLVAVPEILAVLLYTTPGLVPAKDELAEKKEEITDLA